MKICELKKLFWRILWSKKIFIHEFFCLNQENLIKNFFLDLKILRIFLINYQINFFLLRKLGGVIY